MRGDLLLGLAVCYRLFIQTRTMTMHVYMYVPAYVHVHVHVCTCVCICVCGRIQIIVVHYLPPPLVH